MSNELKIRISDKMGELNEFTSFKSLIDLLKQEKIFWTDVNLELDELNKTKQFPYIKLHLKLQSWIDSLEKYVENDGAANLSNDEISGIINNINQKKWLSCTRNYTKAYIECYKKFGFDPAEKFLTIVSDTNVRSISLNISNSFDMLAMLSAYEYLSKDGDFSSRRSSELSALKELYKSYLKSKNELDENIISINNHHRDDVTINKNTFNDLCNEISNKNKEIMTDHDASFTKLYEQSTKKMSELEKTYENKLTLSAPVLYWKKAAKINGRYGLFWGLLLGLIVSAGIGLFSFFFYRWLGSHDLPVKLSSIQGVVVFGVILALFTVAIRMVSKMMLSSFHSKHDADERVNLVYLYLALKHKNKIDDKHSEIVLQALFSRSDSGLLSKDTGIVMPSVQEVIKANN